MFAGALFLLVMTPGLGGDSKSGEEYAGKLGAAERTAESHFRLATWARKQGMDDVAAGHLRLAVHLDPQFAPAQKALGRSQRSGMWETHDERAARLAKEKALQAEREDWRRLLADVGIALAVQRQSLSEAGVAAIEEFASPDETASRTAAKVLGESDLGAATLALVRQAVFSRFPAVRAVSAELLAQRNPDYVLPGLLEYLRPRHFGKTFLSGIGMTWYWSEGTTMFVSLPAPRAPIMRANRLALVFTPNQAGTVEDLLEESALIRENAAAALRAVTGLKHGDEFSVWRKVVMEMDGSFIESRAASPTRTVTTYHHPDTLAQGTFVERMDCFAPGTLVATKRGALPIDKVCLGELVLSRNVETGETAHKPVLARTLRPRTPMRSLAVNGETIRASAAHPVWTRERGWTKAKDLAEGATLTAEDASIRLTGNSLGDSEQGYNLVVADFGTYFVGKSRLLVHDNTPIREGTAKR